MSSAGSFFSGTSSGVIDLLMIPFAYRIDVLLRHYRDFALPATGATWSRYQRWYEALCDTAAFRATATDHAGYRERLIAFCLPYCQGRGQQDVKHAS